MDTYMAVDVNFDALAQASDFRIESRQVAFLWWDRDSNPGVCETRSAADWMPTHQPTELSKIKQKLELNSPSL